MKIAKLVGFLATVVMMSSLVPSIARSQQPPIWESEFGTGLFLSDDDTEALSFDDFAFPFQGNVFGGTDVLDVSSNGFVSLGGSNGDDCCDGSVFDFLNDPFPRIAPLFLDINPSASGDVFVNRFNDDADAAIDRLVVTWDSVIFGTGEQVLAQLQLLETGVIVFGYDGIPDTNSGTASIGNTLVGVGGGQEGTADPGPTDLSALPFLGGSTVYEFFNQAGDIIDLDGTNLVFTPIPQGGFIVASGSVPEPSTGLLLFIATGLSASRRRS